MGKRDEFWKSLWSDDGETIAWPSEPSQRGGLAAKIVGAAVVGAAEHVLGESLDRLSGQLPVAGADDYQAKLRDAKVLSSFTAEQRDVVTRLVRDAAFFGIYWPFVKLRQPPGVGVRLVAERDGEGVTTQESFDLTEFLEPHQLLLQWVEEFGEFLDPQTPLDDRWKDLLLCRAELERVEQNAPFTGELVTGHVVFSGPNMMVVRVGDRNVKVGVPAEVAKGEAVRLGLSPQGHPRVIEIRGKRIDVP